jgi:hypothetical protein
MALPSISEPYSFNFDGFLRGDNMLSALRHVTISVVGTKISGNAMHGIIKRLVDVKELHFRFCPSKYEDELQVPTALVRTTPMGHCLLSMATNIAFHDYRFGYLGPGLETISFPLVRALALVNCQGARYFFDQLQANQYPSLSALMITGDSYLPMYHIQSSLREVTSLRELILDGSSAEISDAAFITDHADTLELLSLVRGFEQVKRPVFGKLSNEQIDAMFSSMTKLRHLCLSIRGHSLISLQGSMSTFNKASGVTLVSLTSCLQHNAIFLTRTGIDRQAKHTTYSAYLV